MSDLPGGFSSFVWPHRGISLGLSHLLHNQRVEKPEAGFSLFLCPPLNVQQWIDTMYRHPRPIMALFTIKSTWCISVHSCYQSPTSYPIHTPFLIVSQEGIRIYLVSPASSL